MKRFIATAMPIALVALIHQSALADVIHVPDDYPTIQEAIDASVYGDEIIVAPGIYNESINLLGRQIYLHSSAGAEQTIIDGAGLDRIVIWCSKYETAETIIEGFKVINGEGQIYGAAAYIFSASPTFVGCIFERNGPATYGGAVHVQFGSPRFVQCVFVENTCLLWGGAVYEEVASSVYEQCEFINNGSKYGSGYGEGGAVYSDACDSVFTECLFESNAASYGGAVRAYHCELAFQDCAFKANSAGTGGAVYASDNDAISIERSDFDSNTARDDAGAIDCSDSPLAIDQSTFSHNDAGYGGGAIHVQGAVATLNHCRFVGNRANDARSNDDGGGAIMLRRARARVADCYFEDNFADNHGGAVASSKGTLLMARCDFERNIGRSGGGLQLYRCNAYVVDCTFKENRATGEGGALHAEGLRKRAYVIGCLAARNTAARGGALAITDPYFLSIDCSTFVDNQADTPNWGNLLMTDSYGKSWVRFQNSIMRNGQPEIANQDQSYIGIHYCNITNGFAGDGNIDADPMFRNPDESDYRLRSGSPCIDAGDRFAVPKDLDWDLDENPRFVDSPWVTDNGNGFAPVVDMGCYENQALTGPSLRVFPDPLRTGQQAVFRLTDGRNHTLAFLVYSVSGEGPVYVPLLNVKLDLRKPTLIGEPKRTDADGSTNWLLRIPKDAAGLDVWFQVAQQNVKTNFVETHVD